MDEEWAGAAGEVADEAAAEGGWVGEIVETGIGDVLRICVPSTGAGGLNDDDGQHFGRVPTYTIVDTETGDVEIIDNTSEHMGGQGYPPEIIARAGVDIMLCGGLGRRAVMMFEQLGIMVYVGAFGKVEDAVNSWKEGKLEAATDENACRQHAHRGERHCESPNHDHH